MKVWVNVSQDKAGVAKHHHHPPHDGTRTPKPTQLFPHNINKHSNSYKATHLQQHLPLHV